ncbi:hypothetical protein X777_11875 [Ooceraea biroi]|nr:hypothetical protein X777_11875 [Ooceraea biroi]
MRLRRVLERHFLLLFYLLIINLVYASSVEVSEVPEAENKDFHDATLLGNQQHSVPEATTPSELADVADTDRRLTSPTVVEPVVDRPENKSDIFRPSVHLGAIEEPVARVSNPFNGVQHVRFEDGAQPFIAVQRERSQDVGDVYRDMPGLLDEATRSSRIRFQDEVAAPTPAHHLDDRQVGVTESALRTPLEGLAAMGHVYVDQSFFQDVERPVETHDAPIILGKTMGDHRLNGAYLEPTTTPYIISYYAAQNQEQHQEQARPASHEIVFQVPIRRPADNDGVLLLQQQESIYTRKHKFPYQFYQPTSSGEHHGAQFTEEHQHSTMVHPRTRRMSPWKKIARLIGTFLPLGLLLATLTPNVVRITNTTTQPNIILSKFRVADLPIEHKRGRMLNDHSEVCEDRSICELILAGGEPQSDILQNILWNLATRTPDHVAKRNGLREVFSAVKKKDCTTISC